MNETMKCLLNSGVCMKWSVAAGAVETVVKVDEVAADEASRIPSTSSFPSSPAPLFPFIYQLSWLSLDSEATDLDIMVRIFREIGC